MGEPSTFHCHAPEKPTVEYVMDRLTVDQFQIRSLMVSRPLRRLLPFIPRLSNKTEKFRAFLLDQKTAPDSRERCRMHIYVVDLHGRAIAGRGFGSQEAAEMILDERPIRELLAASAGMISKNKGTYAVRLATDHEADIWVRNRADFARGDSPPA
jgi:hypothetical protein